MEAEPNSNIPTLKSLRLTRGWRKRFSQEEDQTIYNWVELIGACKWKLCALLLDRKSEKQVRDRWFNNLDPSFHCKKWDKIEDYLILKLYTLNGPKWSYISSFLDRRCASQVKNRFYGIMKKSKSKNAQKNLSSLNSRNETINQIIIPYDSLLIKKGFELDFTNKFVLYELRTMLEVGSTRISLGDAEKDILENFSNFENAYTQDFNNNISNVEELDQNCKLLKIKASEDGYSPTRSCNSFFM